MDYSTWSSLTELFFAQAKRHADKPFLWAKRDGRFQPWTWAEVPRGVKELSRGLRDLGLQRGDRVVLVSENRPEWVIADLAIMAAGGITVPAYVTNTREDHAHILGNSGAVGAVVSTAALAQRLLPAAEAAPDCRWSVAMEPVPDAAGGASLEVFDWDDVRQRGAAQPDDVEDYAAKAERDDVCCFIYTSGTGGAPKGVMLSHGNILANCHGAHVLVSEIGIDHEIYLSFLPLSHSYEHTVGAFFTMSIGAEVYFAESVETLLSDLATVKPTIMTAVPRLYESIHQRIERGLKKEKPFKRKLFAKTLEIGLKRYRDPSSLSLWDKILDLPCEHLVRKKIRQRFGGRLKGTMSGGAALNPDIGEYFLALGLNILQGYGQTEAAPVIAANPPRRVKIDTVGPPIDGVEVKIADDGELLARGEMVMKGYWGDEEATARTVVDGWLHTGDIAEIDDDGYIKITDRKKDIIVLSGGDNVSPARIEGQLTMQPEIHQAMVYGDKHPHLVALLVPDEEWLNGWAREQGLRGKLAEPAGQEALRKAMGAVIERVNDGLSNLEKLRRFEIVSEPFTVENGMMTPTLKIRRHMIKANYGEALEALYGRAAAQ